MSDVQRSYGTLDELIKAERARRQHLGGTHDEPATEPEADPDADEAEVEQEPVTEPEETPASASTEKSTPPKQALGAVSNFVKANADFSIPPKDEAARLFALAQEQGIQTTVGSLLKVIRDLSRAKSRGGRFNAAARKKGTVRDFVRANADLTKGNWAEARRLMAMAMDAGIKTTFNSLSQAITIARREAGMPSSRPSKNWSASIAKRQATMQEKYGTISPRHAHAKNGNGDPAIVHGAKPKRGRPRTRPTVTRPTVTRAEALVAGAAEQRGRMQPGSTLGQLRWQNERRATYRQAVESAFKHHELDVLYAEIGMAMLRDHLKSSE